MNEEKLISGRYKVNLKTARKIRLYAKITGMRVTDCASKILEENVEKILPDTVLKKIEDRFL